MHLHDVLMGRMDSVMSEGQRLQRLAGRVDTTTAAGRRQAAQLRRLGAALRNADARMMDWMHRFQPDTAKLTVAQTESFWTRELQTLRRIQAQTSAALDATCQVQ